uniref:Uncharacterized protein n=1 Tax=Anopheles epiroticus TaxID=199890 RepID=A0A182PQG4_9DIPT
MMHIKSSPTTPVAGEKRPKPAKKEQVQQESRKVSSFIQRFYLFGNNTSTPFGPEAESEAPKIKKAKASEHQTICIQRDQPKSTVRSSSAESTEGTVSSSDVSEEQSPQHQIHWARRTELLGIRALTQEEKRQSNKMPLRVENYVSSYIDVDIQSVAGQDESAQEAAAPAQEPPAEVLDKLPPIPHTSTPVTPARQPSSSSSLGRKGNTPTRKISFLNNISPYNRKLLACNGTKVAALTSKFNQMIQQDAGLLAQVQKRGGYLHKCGNVAYKVIEDPGGDGLYGFTSTGRNSNARSSLRKKNSNASATSGGTGAATGTGGNRTDESSDEISSASSKNSSLRKTGVRKRPSLRKNIYRRPEWETGRSSLGVRKVLEMFEPNLQHHGRGKRTESGDTGKPPPGRSKPKVPDKSEQVLQKTKDIKSKKGFGESSVQAAPEATEQSPAKDTSERSPEKDTSEQKILEAISAVSQRIDNLSRSFNDLTLTDEESNQKDNQLDGEEDVQEVRPNASFLFRGLGAGISGATMGSKHASQRNIVEAVNTVVINKSVSMDDHHFPCARGEMSRMSLNERSRVQRGLEDDYEPVTRPDEKLSLTASSVSCSTPAITIDLMELTSKIESFVHKSKRESDNIYQSIPIKSPVAGNNDLRPDDAISINSYESFENYESIEHEILSSTRTQNCEEAKREEDTYEICSPPPELPPAREDSRNDLTLPQPKRNLSSSPKTLPKHLQVTYQSNYERIKYSKIPPRPPKPEEVPLPPRNNSSTSAATATTPIVTQESTFPSTETASSPGGDLLDKSPHGQQESIYEENIYDTIRSADDGVDYDDPACGSAELEPSQASIAPTRGRSFRAPPADNVSLVSSNCYESIGVRLEYERNLTLTRRNLAGGSTTTLASDQITNSLYGTTAGLASLTPPSERGSDTSNSADWTDISDDEAEVGERSDVALQMGTVTAGSKRPNFIV